MWMKNGFDYPNPSSHNRSSGHPSISRVTSASVWMQDWLDANRQLSIFFFHLGCSTISAWWFSTHFRNINQIGPFPQFSWWKFKTCETTTQAPKAGYFLRRGAGWLITKLSPTVKAKSARIWIAWMEIAWKLAILGSVEPYPSLPKVTPPLGPFPNGPLITSCVFDIIGCDFLCRICMGRQLHSWLLPHMSVASHSAQTGWNLIFHRLAARKIPLLGRL